MNIYKHMDIIDIVLRIARTYGMTVTGVRRLKKAQADGSYKLITAIIGDMGYCDIRFSAFEVRSLRICDGKTDVDAFASFILNAELELISRNLKKESVAR